MHREEAHRRNDRSSEIRYKSCSHSSSEIRYESCSHSPLFTPIVAPGGSAPPRWPPAEDNLSGLLCRMSELGPGLRPLEFSSTPFLPPSVPLTSPWSSGNLLLRATTSTHRPPGISTEQKGLRLAMASHAAAVPSPLTGAHGIRLQGMFVQVHPISTPIQSDLKAAEQQQQHIDLDCST